MVAYALYVVFCVLTYTTIYARLDKSRKTVSHQVRDSFPGKSGNLWEGWVQKAISIFSYNLLYVDDVDVFDVKTFAQDGHLCMYVFFMVGGATK